MKITLPINALNEAMLNYVKKKGYLGTAFNYIDSVEVRVSITKQEVIVSIREGKKR